MATNKFIGNNTLSNFVTNTGGMVSMPTQNSNNSVNNGGLSAEVKKSIADYVDSQGFTGMDRQLKIQELEQETIKKKQENLYKQGREDVKAELYQKSLDKQNPAGAAQAKEQGRLADLADMVRGYTQKTDGKELQGDDNKVVGDFLKANQNMIAPFASYMNGDQSAYDFAKMYGFDTNFDPVAEKRRWGGWRGSLVGDNAELNDDIFGHFEATSYDDAGEGFWNKVGTFGLNTLKSTWNLASDVVNVVANPFDTVNNLSKMVVGGLMNLTTLDDYLDPDGEGWINSANQVADGLGDYLVQRYGGWDNIKNTLYTDPVGVVSDVASVIEGGAGIVKGATKAGAVGAAKVGLKNLSKNLDDVSRVSGNVSKVAHYADPFNEIMEGGGRVAKRGYNKAAPKISDAVDSFVGLDSKTKKSIQSNPYTNSTWKDVENYINENGLPERSQEVSKSLISDLSDAVKEDLKKYVDQFNETGPLYRTLKNGNYSVDLTSMKQKLDSFLEEQGVKIGEGGYLDFTDTAVTPTEASAIRRAYQWLTPNEAEPVSQYLRHRKGIDQLYNWENTKGTPGRDILKAMREMANDEAHAQIKPLESLDKLYAEQIGLINDATEGLVYRDKRKLGQYRDNFNQILKNMDTPNRARMKERLEKIIPGIEQKVEAINLMPKLIDNYYRPGKANKWLSSVSGMAGASIGGVPGAIIGAGIGYGASKLYDLIKSKRWNSVVSNLSEEGKANLANIEQSIKNNQKLSADQAEYLSRISEELKANKKLKEAQVTDILQRIATAEEGSELSVLDDVMKELKKIGANDELKEVSQIREGVVKEMGEQAEMDKYAQEFEAEKENIINDAADQRLPEFKKKIYQLQQEERRIGSVAGKKIGKSFEGKDWKSSQQTEWLRKKDRLIEEIGEYYNVDQFEAAEIYDRIERTASADDLGFSGKPASSKTAYQRYGTANPNEKGISATEGLNIRNFKNGKTVQELANQYGIDTKIVDSISTPEGQRAYGMYGDRLITLSKDLKESTVPHELLHGVFDMVDNTRKAEILDGIKKRLNVDNVQAEEWLADNFSEYYRTGKFDVKGIPTTFVGKVKQFFQQIKEYIDGTYANRKEIGKLFDDIIDGKIEGEYGVYSDPKFQSVWHGSPEDFERFDSTHMGEGEGAQAHGWGHYVAKEKGTAEHYATVRGGEVEFRGKNIDDYISGKEGIYSSVEKAVLSDMKQAMSEWFDTPELAKERLWGNYNAEIRRGEDKIFAKAKLNSLENMDVDDFTNKGANLYEVEIPDPIKKDTPTGSNYLEEKGELPAMAKNEFAITIADKLGDDAYHKFMGEIGSKNILQGEDVYVALGHILGSDKEASKFLESLGYDGIHYFGGRDGEAYVIFNDDALEITKHHKY